MGKATQAIELRRIALSAAAGEAVLGQQRLDRRPVPGRDAGDDQILVRGDPVCARDGPRRSPEGRRARRGRGKAAAFDEQGAVEAAAFRLAPAERIAVGVEMERPGRLERSAEARLDLAFDPAQALVVDRIFEAGAVALGAVAVIALDRHHRPGRGDQPVLGDVADHVGEARVGGGSFSVRPMPPPMATL